MNISQPYLLVLTLVFGLEYWVKQWADNLYTKRRRPLQAYINYRLLHAAALFSLGFLLFDAVDAKSWLFFSLLAVLLGSCELLTAVLRRWYGKAWQAKYYWLNFLIPLGLAVVSRLMAPFLFPRWAVDYRLPFLFVFLGHPTNYFIRWILTKEETSFVDSAAGQVGPLLGMPNITTETAAAASAAQKYNGEINAAALQAGRLIGILERWLIIVLTAAGSITGLGLVITAKSIVRYPKLSEPHFAEYYLVGTLLSVVLAALSGYILLGGG